MQYSATNLSETRKVARDLITALVAAPKQPHAAVIALSGELGSGKTAFVREFVAEAGGPAQVTSPTFVLIQQFPLPGTALPFERIIHIDAYRIEDASELTALYFDDLVRDPGNLIFIEWPQQITDILPKQSSSIEFVLHDDGTRTIIIPDILR